MWSHQCNLHYICWIKLNLLRFWTHLSSSLLIIQMCCVWLQQSSQVCCSLWSWLSYGFTSILHFIEKSIHLTPLTSLFFILSLSLSPSLHFPISLLCAHTHTGIPSWLCPSWIPPYRFIWTWHVPTAGQSGDKRNWAGRSPIWRGLPNGAFPQCSYGQVEWVRESSNKGCQEVLKAWQTVILLYS